jgi:hypothetical protein
MNDSNAGQVTPPILTVQASCIPTKIPPARATTSPIATIDDNRSRKMSGENSPTHSGVVVTSTTELATLVYSSEVIQVAK